MAKAARDKRKPADAGDAANADNVKRQKSAKKRDRTRVAEANDEPGKKSRCGKKAVRSKNLGE